MRVLPRKELIERVNNIYNTPVKVTDYLVLRDREMALNKLPDYKLREIIYNSNKL